MIQPVLNKLDRKTVYEQTLIAYNNHINNNDMIGLCPALSEAVEHLGVYSYHDLTTHALVEYFPEINKYNPNCDYFSYWFPIDRVTTRTIILKQAIKETGGN